MDFLTLMFAPFTDGYMLLGGTLWFFVLGWLWYSPVTPTGNIWGKHFPMPKHTPKPHQIVIMVLFQIFMGFIITHTVMVLWSLMGGYPDTLKTLILIKGFMGFVFVKDLGHWFFERRPFSLVLIGTGYYLVGVLGVALILSYLN